MDNLTLNRIKLLHPKLRSDVESIYKECCERIAKDVVLRFTSTYRTNGEQDSLYSQGRTTKGNVVTMAKGGESYHNYGLAIDVCLILNGVQASWDFNKDYDHDGVPDLMECVKVFKNHGWEWAGEWKTFREFPHFQYTFGKTIKQLQSAEKFIQDNLIYPFL